MKRWWIIVCLVGLPAIAGADGMFTGGVATEDTVGDRVAGRAGVASTEQKGIIIELPEGREALLLQTTYHGPADRFAWVIPVPGKPGKEDVFLASTDFIDALLDNTRPEVHTTITDPRIAQRGYMGGKTAEEGIVAPGAADMEGGAEPTVIVHERMEVGDYDVTILSATGAEVLTDWLTDNGYQIPEDSDDTLGHYVEKSWYFVAVKMQPGKVEERPVLEDVAPIGIRFAAEQLVYPLYISRASSREKTALLLAILSKTPIECDQLPDARLPLGKHFPKGTCYAAIRRQAVDGPEAAAVCEFRGPEGMPYVDLHYQKESWGGPEGPEWSPGYLWTTRLWTLLDLDELEDLTFSSSADKRALKVHVVREGEIHTPVTEKITTTSTGLLWLYTAGGALLFLLASYVAKHGLVERPGHAATTVVIALVLAFILTILTPIAWLIVILLGLVWLLGTVRRMGGQTEPEERSGKARDVVCGALIAAGVGGFGHTAYLMLIGPSRFLYGDALGRYIRELWRGDVPTTTSLLVLALQLAFVLLVADLVRRGLRGAGVKAVWLAVPWLALVVLFALPFGGRFVADLLNQVRPAGPPLPALQAALAATVLALGVVTFGALLLVVAYALIGSLVSRAARPTAQPMGHTLLGLVFLSAVVSGAGMMMAYAGSPGYIVTGIDALDSGLQNLDDMLTRFRAKYGCYPARLEDMLSTASPSEGLDSSGNRVPLTQSGKAEAGDDPEPPTGPGWPATQLPADPLTGRSDTWVYEATGSPMIDSGGYKIVIEVREVATAEEIASWRPDRPLPGKDAWQMRQRFYWQSSREMSIPFLHPGERVFTGGRVSEPGLVLRRFVHASEGHQLLLADVSAHAAVLGDAEAGLEIFAWAPDGNHLVYARNGPHGTRILTSTIFGRESRMLLGKPWPVEVYDIDWHPTEEKWLVLARDLEGDARARIYLLSGDGVPRPITQPDNYVAARFSPDGAGILAIATEAPWQTSLYDSQAQRPPHLLGKPGSGYGRGPVSGALWRISLEGQREEKLAENAIFTLLTRSSFGALAVIAGAQGDEGLLFIDKGASPRRIDLPTPNSQVVDAWVGPGRLAVALVNSQTGQPGTQDHAGGVREYDLTSGEWRLIARWETGSRSSTRRGVDLIVGRDAVTGAYVLFSESSVYAVRRAAPRLEILASPSVLDPERPIEVEIAGRPQKVVVEGFYEAAEFDVGDLISTSGGAKRTPVSALPVAMKEGGRILVGDRWIKSSAEDVAVLRRAGRSCYAKLKPL
jgi:hypothetical protein